MATCRKCGKNPAKDRVCLARVNEIGVLPAIWECRPSCDAKLSDEPPNLSAILLDWQSQVAGAVMTAMETAKPGNGCEK